jgi:hypothetical protein
MQTPNQNQNPNANRNSKSKIHTISQTAPPTKEILRRLPFFIGFSKIFKFFGEFYVNSFPVG